MTAEKPMQCSVVSDSIFQEVLSTITCLNVLQVNVLKELMMNPEVQEGQRYSRTEVMYSSLFLTLIPLIHFPNEKFFI